MVAETKLKDVFLDFKAQLNAFGSFNSQASCSSHHEATVINHIKLSNKNNRTAIISFYSVSTDVPAHCCCLRILLGTGCHHFVGATVNAFTAEP